MKGWPVIAGIPLVAARADGQEPPRHWLPDDWHDAEPSADPLRIVYEAGAAAVDIAGLAGIRPLLSSADISMGTYYRDAAGELAVLAGMIEGPPQLMRTRRAGYEYSVGYADAAQFGEWQWRWPRNVFSYAIAARRLGLVAHASAAIVAGGGLLFPGVSEQGKTTIARALHATGNRDVRVLTDDRAALTAVGGDVQVWGTPWYSAAHLATGEGAPLAGVIFPARGGAEPQLRSLSRSEGMRRLLRILAFPVWSAPLTDWALGFADAVLAGAPAFELSYTAAEGVGETLVELLKPIATGAAPIHA